MYTPSLYTDEELDQGVALAAGAYRVQWGEYGSSYWKNPTPPDVYYDYHYVFDWQNADETIKVEIEKLKNYVRGGVYLERAFDYIQEQYGAAEITIMPLFIEGEIVATDFYVVCVGGITTVNPDLDVAKWQAAGIWGMNNLFATANIGYLKISDGEPCVFMVDENTFLVL
jgi:hypothetical protein